jgi:hypothetical protein
MWVNGNGEWRRERVVASRERGRLCNSGSYEFPESVVVNYVFAFVIEVRRAGRVMSLDLKI